MISKENATSMAGSSAQRRKKKQKVNKPATSTSKIPVTKSRTKKKRKTRLSREYQAHEREVQQLLDDNSLQLNLSSYDSKELDLDSQSAEFFCSGHQTYRASSRGTVESPVMKTNGVHTGISDSVELNTAGNVYDEAEEDVSSQLMTHSDQSISTHDDAAGGNQTQTASTFIQIEHIEPDAYTRLTPGAQYNFDDDLTYKPKAKLHYNVRLESTTLNANTKRMLNRYYEEAKSTDQKLSKDITSSLQQAKENARKFQADKTLYRTYCPYEFHPIFCDATPNTVEIPTRKFVKFYIKELRFTQHPHLCEEHSLANELEEIYEEYAKRLEARICEELNSRLQIERNIVNAMLKHASTDTNMSTSVGYMGKSPRAAEHHFQKLQEHLFNVKELRTRLYEEEAQNKRLLKSILDKWLQLKKLRKNQEYQCTRFKLSIKLQDLNYQTINRARKAWKISFENDLAEIYREELEIYYTAKRLWQQNSSRDKTSLTSANVKPKKPTLTCLSTELQERFAECFRLPEEPIVELERCRVSDEEFYENTIKMINNNSSQQRKLRSFFLKIFFDREFVAETRSYRLEPDLSLRINEAMGIFLEHRLPKDIKMKLYEKSKISTPKKIAKMMISLPASSSLMETEETFPLQNIKFSSTKEPMAGRLLLGLTCTEQIAGKEHIPRMLNKQSQKSCIDEDDGQQQESSDEDEQELPTAQSDTCTFAENELQFCSIDEITNNPRFRILRSRYFKNDERTRDLRFVPALENELEFNGDSEEEEAVIEAGNWMDSIDLHKYRGKRYLKTLYETIRNQCARLDKVMESTENLLIGDVPNTWSALFEALTSIFHPGRPLNPGRNNTLKSDHFQNRLQWHDGGQSFKVILNVVRATGVPVRYRNALDTESVRQRSSGSSNMFITQNLKYSHVRPFVALCYKDKFCRTITAEGSNPTWNEQLILQLSGSLTELREDLKILLFDEVVESHLNDDLSNVRNMDIYQRIQANWLGEYRIPMGTILKRQKMEGNFELNTPKVLLGYKRPSLENLTTTTIASETNIIVEIKENVQLYFYLSIEPSFELPSVNTKTLECSELRDVRQQLHEWSLIVREIQPQRYIEPLVCTADGKRVCLTRLLEAVPLPMESSENLLDSVMRYVMLLNTLKQYDACSNSYRGVWLNNQILLDTTWGAAKDLGVLLCNFLLTLGLKCWLVLGVASTAHAEATFVLHKQEDGSLQLLDPCAGKRYSVKDVLCPLNKISYIVASDNIYCNIQSETRIAMMSFNFNDTAFWLPAFNKRNPAPLGGVQKLNYVFHNSLNTAELMKNIERKVMKKITSWRTMRKTVWNRAFQARLHSILLQLEAKSTFVSNSNDEQRYADQLAAEYPTYKLYGFTLNFSYTNLSAISERIRAFGIHFNSDQNVEFSLAVHVHSYPNNVLSVWLFLISLTPQNLTQ